MRDQPLPLVPPLGLLLLAQLVLPTLALATAAPPIAAQLLVVVAASLVVVALPTSLAQIVAPPAPRQLLEEKVIGGSIDSSSLEDLRFSVLISEHFCHVSRFKYKLPWQRQRFDKDINRALLPWSPF